MKKEKLLAQKFLFDILIEIQNYNFVPKPLKKFAYDSGIPSKSRLWL